jgi:hypothetical protein
VNKGQNSRVAPGELIRKTLEAGILFLYGLVLDVANRPIDALENELDAMLATPGIALPSYASVSIPILGTPFFRQCVADDRLLPHTRVRDLDGTTLSLRALDDQPRVERFVRDLMGFRGRRWRTARQAWAFARRWRGTLSPAQLAIGAFNAAILCAPVLSSAPVGRGGRAARTYVSTTEILDRTYRPAFPVAARFAANFRPTMLTDAAGRVHELLAPDLLAGARVPALASAMP